MELVLSHAHLLRVEKRLGYSLSSPVTALTPESIINIIIATLVNEGDASDNPARLAEFIRTGGVLWVFTPSLGERIAGALTATEPGATKLVATITLPERPESGYTPQ